MLDAVMSRFDPFPGEELRSELDEFSHPDIEVNEQNVVARLSMPGFRKEDVTVEIENDMLHVRAERTAEPAKNGGKHKVIRSERFMSEFAQSVRLPVAVKGAEATALYRDGVLTVSAPREIAAGMLSRKIEVK